MILIFFYGCGLFAPPVSDISEIAFRGQTGMLGSAYTVSFRNDGTTNCECSFYRLEADNKPNLEFVNNICTELYKKDSKLFIEEKDTYSDKKLTGVFTGKINKEKFDDLARTLQKTSFFLIPDVSFGGATLDKPPDFVKVVYEGKSKEVSDESIDLSEIKNALIETAKETSWLAKKK